MSRVFDATYLFSVMPGDANWGFWRPVMIIAIVAIVFGIVAFFIAQRYANDGLRRHLWQRYGSCALTFGSVSLMLAFFRIQNAYLLSMRALIFMWLLFSAGWVIRILVYTIWKLPKKLRVRDEKAFFEKYLPHKNKK